MKDEKKRDQSVRFFRLVVEPGAAREECKEIEAVCVFVKYPF